MGGNTVCTTFCAVGSRSENHRPLIGRNCDRHIGDPPSTEFFPAADHAAGEMVACTCITIPQVSHTYSFWGSRISSGFPVEHGVNEHGVAVIVNAMHSVVDTSEDNAGLIMGDYVRLALERAETAKEAAMVVAGLVERYGQNAGQGSGPCRKQEAGFFFSDPQDAWRLETAGRMWVLEHVTDRAWAMTNCYGIETDFERSASGLSAYMQEHRLTPENSRPSFARDMNEPGLNYLGNLLRVRRMQRILDREQSPVTLPFTIRALRDHYESEPLLAPHHSVSDAVIPSICMHPHIPADAKTDSSIILTYDEVLGPVCWMCYSCPCTSAYIPIYFTGCLPTLLETKRRTYDASSLWWTMEWLSIVVEMDYARYAPTVRRRFDTLEQQFLTESTLVEELARKEIQKGRQSTATTALNDFMEICAQRLHKEAQQLVEELYAKIVQSGGPYGPRNLGLYPNWKELGFPLVKASQFSGDRPILIGCQGGKNSNNHQAACAMAESLGIPNYQLEFLNNSENVVQSLRERHIDLGVMAIRTDVSGEVQETKLASSGVPMEVLCTVNINIHHCLFARSDDRTMIRTVASHPEALKECINTIWRLYPHVELHPLADTASSAVLLSQGDLPGGTAVICSREAGLQNGLVLLQEDIEDRPQNGTTFEMVKLKL